MELLNIVHQYWGYLVVLVVGVATINALIGFFGKREYSPKDFRLALFALIVTHLQFVIGAIVYVTSAKGLSMLTSNEMSVVMKDSYVRLFAIEHPVGMILAIVFITIGYSKHKKKLVSTPKFKMLAIFYTLAFLCILKMIPWATYFQA